MRSNFETGQAKNLSNYHEIVSAAEGHGSVFNPTKPSLKIEALKKKESDCLAAIDDVKTAFAVLSNAIEARESAFLPMSKTSTRIVNALKASETTDHVVENAMTFVRKIQGRRAATKKAAKSNDPTVVIKEISSSQMSFDNRLDNLKKLVKYLESIGSYAPNEADLQVQGLKLFSAELDSKNASVVKANTDLSNARIKRNDLMYKPGSGLVDTALDVKAYIKSVFGATSPQFKQISKLDFTRLN